jgi:hypothetical protein
MAYSLKQDTFIVTCYYNIEYSSTMTSVSVLSLYFFFVIFQKKFNQLNKRNLFRVLNLIICEDFFTLSYVMLNYTTKQSPYVYIFLYN